MLQRIQVRRKTAPATPRLQRTLQIARKRCLMVQAVRLLQHARLQHLQALLATASLTPLLQRLLQVIGAQVGVRLQRLLQLLSTRATHLHLQRLLRMTLALQPRFST